MTISSNIYKTIPIDTVKIPISYIRLANQVFVERDRLEEELLICTKINSINARIVDNCDSIISRLEIKVENLNLIITTNAYMNDATVQDLEDRLKKSRRANIALAGLSAVFIAILIII